MNKKLDDKGLAPMIIVIALLVVVATGVAYWSTTKSNKPSANKVLSSQKSDLPTDLSGLLTVEKIKELTLAEKAGATIKQVELEMINNVLVYKVQLLDGSLLAFNAKDGTKVTLSQGEESESEEDNLPPGTINTITFEKAIEIARAKYSDKVVRKVELEVENGKVVYSVRFTDGSRVDVDANTGEIAQSKDSVVEDKDKDDDGVLDDQEAGEENEMNDDNSSSESQKSNDSSESSDDRDADDEKEDEIEFKKSDSSKKDD